MRLAITKYKLTKPKTIFNIFGTNITPVFLSFHYPLLRSNFSATKRNKETKKEKKPKSQTQKQKERIGSERNNHHVQRAQYALLNIGLNNQLMFGFGTVKLLYFCLLMSILKIMFKSSGIDTFS